VSRGDERGKKGGELMEGVGEGMGKSKRMVLIYGKGRREVYGEVGKHNKKICDKK